MRSCLPLASVSCSLEKMSEDHGSQAVCRESYAGKEWVLEYANRRLTTTTKWHRIHVWLDQNCAQKIAFGCTYRSHSTHCDGTSLLSLPVRVSVRGSSGCQRKRSLSVCAQEGRRAGRVCDSHEIGTQDVLVLQAARHRIRLQEHTQRISTPDPLHSGSKQVRSELEHSRLYESGIQKCHHDAKGPVSVMFVPKLRSTIRIVHSARCIEHQNRRETES